MCATDTAEDGGEGHESCAYCGLEGDESLLRCRTCSRCFCSRVDDPRAGSHAVLHVVLSHHPALAPLSPDLGGPLECYNESCRRSNLFALGFVTARRADVVLLLCRRCATTHDTGANPPSGWDLTSWTPLVASKTIVDWLCPPPSAEQVEASRTVLPSQIRQLESLWADPKTANASLSTLLQTDAATADDDTDLPLPNTKAVYESAKDYINTYIPLIKAEMEDDVARAEMSFVSGVSILWESGSGMRTRALIEPLQIAEYFTVSRGDLLVLSHPGDTLNPAWSSPCVVMSVPAGVGGHIILALESARSTTSSMFVDSDDDDQRTTSTRTKYRKSFKSKKEEPIPEPPMHISLGFTLRATSNPVQFQRKSFAINHLTNINRDIMDILLGKHGVNNDVVFSDPESIPETWDVPGVTSLNEPQRVAVDRSIRRKVSLIQGPPGTGKTTTSATVVYHMLKNRVKGSSPRDKVLVCAPTNVAVEHLAEKLNAIGITATRIISDRLEQDLENTSPFSLKRKAINHPKASNELRLLARKFDARGELSKSELIQYKSLLQHMYTKVLTETDVVCCTLVSAGSSVFRKSNCTFSDLLIDEAAQATEPETMVAISHNVRRITLVGDHQQLGPVISNQRLVKAGMDISLFERLALSNMVPTRLNIQFRMHPILSEFPSNIFYEGTLQNGVSIYDRTEQNDDRDLVPFPWPKMNNPAIFICNRGPEQIGSNGVSTLNPSEADIVLENIKYLLRAGVSPDDIGVITPYDAQRAYVLMLMDQAPTRLAEAMSKVEVASVNSFQGREKRYIIFTCVRSNESNTIGFLADARRLNVALTRAKYGLIIVGNPDVLCRNTLWNMLLVWYQRNDLVFSMTPKGSKNSHPFTRITLHLPRPTGAGKVTLEKIMQRNTFAKQVTDLNSAKEEVGENGNGTGNVRVNKSSKSRRGGAPLSSFANIDLNVARNAFFASQFETDDITESMEDLSIADV